MRWSGDSVNQGKPSRKRKYQPEVGMADQDEFSSPTPSTGDQQQSKKAKVSLFNFLFTIATYSNQHHAIFPFHAVHVHVLEFQI